MRPSADTLLVWTGAPCSYGCGACPIDQAAAPVALDAETLQRALLDLAEDRGHLALLVGGEPFLRPDLLRLLAAIRSAGFAPGIVTTGRPLVYPNVRQSLRRLGVAYLRIQLFGIGEAHERAVAMSGAFEQTMAALRAWSADAGALCDVDVALSTRRRPIDALAAEVEVLAREVAPHMQIVVAVDPDEAADENALRRAAAALADWNDDPTRPLLAWEGLPPDIAERTQPAIAPLQMRFVATTPNACCLGSIAGLVRQSSADALRARANSFNFVRSGVTVPWTDSAETCTAWRAGAEGKRGRHMWLIDADRLVDYATDTGDFDAAEIARVKDEQSHLFLDRAPAGMLDDFTAGMRRALPDAICDACAHRDNCARRFRLVEAPPFAREEARIAAHIAGLRGRVLDVGCGEQLYRDTLAPLVRAGTVDYTGLDPDAASLDALRAVLPAGRFCLGGIEDFRAAAATYDHILCLRSLNHVADLDEALARMASYLKPGGSLLIVETTPFAMLRTAEQVAAADRAPRAGHQHFRNVASEEVLPYARRRGLQVLEHHPASLQTSNEWILLLERAA
jgi:2-polyprenyl-3-methyl-5-hydroxy-6-metoxy-1,4-benzoquinol methylase